MSIVVNNKDLFYIGPYGRMTLQIEQVSEDSKSSIG